MRLVIHEKGTAITVKRKKFAPWNIEQGSGIWSYEGGGWSFRVIGSDALKRSTGYRIRRKDEVLSTKGVDRC